MKQRIGFRFHTLQERVLRWTKPPTTSLLLDTLADRALGEIGTDCGKRALTTPTKYPPSTDQGTDIPEGRSAASGGSGWDGSDLETGAFPCPARDAAAVAS
jgi:hypothetical protein